MNPWKEKPSLFPGSHCWFSKSLEKGAITSTRWAPATPPCGVSRMIFSHEHRRSWKVHTHTHVGTHACTHRKDKAGDILYLSTSPIKSWEKGGQTFTHQLNNELCVCCVFALLFHTQEVWGRVSMLSKYYSQKAWSYMRIIYFIWFLTMIKI